MIDTPAIIHTEARDTAIIRLTVRRDEIQKVMGPAIQEVMTTLGIQKLSPTGPVFSHHLRMDPEVFEFEVGVPVSGTVTPQGRVRMNRLPAARAARTVYRGPYEGLGEAWGAFMKWIEENGHSPAPNLWEYYTRGPESGGDPSTWETELIRPLTD